MRYGYYPGCSLHGSAVDYHLSLKAISRELDFELIELEDWVCCGSSPAHVSSHLLSLALPLMNLSIAELSGLKDMVVPCAGCFLRFKTTLHEMEGDMGLRDELRQVIEYDYKNEVRVRHLIQVLTEDIGKERITRNIKADLSSLSVACYYGCLLTRPPKVTFFEKDYEAPISMDELVKTIGATSVDWSYKIECCGGSLSLTKIEIVLKLCYDILKNAKDFGADIIVVACPLCQANLDIRQKTIEKGSIRNSTSLSFTLPN